MVTLRDAIRAGLIYGGLAFLAGALLGPLREVVLAPAIGGLAAAWIEAAALAALIWLAAGLVLPDAPNRRGRALIAAVALTVVLVGEAVLSLVFVVTGIAATRPPRGVAEQLPGLLLLAWLVAVPFMRRRD